MVSALARLETADLARPRSAAVIASALFGLVTLLLLLCGVPLPTLAEMRSSDGGRSKLLAVEAVFVSGAVVRQFTL